MKLEPANIICPICGNSNYMRHLSGKGVGLLDMKCINCNSYFNFEELYKYRIEEAFKPKTITNADRIRSMTDEELAEFITARHYSPHCPVPWCEADEATDCEQCWLGWLRKETKSENK